MLESRPLDIAEYLEDDEAIEEFLAAAFESGEPDFIAQSVGIVARAKNMSKLARDIGMSRSALYKALSGEGNPEFGTIMKVLDALGIRLSAHVVSSDKDAA
jgi:probable addiction module antidote protein